MFDALSETIVPPVQMKTANENILIYYGEFEIKQNEVVYNIEGKIEFRWLPHPRVVVTGDTHVSAKEVFSISLTTTHFKLFIEGLLFGTFRLTRLTSNLEGTARISGQMDPYSVKGDHSIPVISAKFGVPNLLELFGSSVKRTTEGRNQISNARLIFENSQYIILLDKDFEYKNKRESLKEFGGYISLYNGEIKKKKGSLTLVEIRNVLDCFSTFLSFVNGRKTCAMFINGMCDEETIWTDYSYFSIDPYKTVHKWPVDKEVEEICNIWRRFYDIWQNEDDRYFLESAINWYVDCNSARSGKHGSIVIAQTALELLYNWLVIENNKLIVGKDAENIGASNKIRLLLSFLKVDHSVPQGLEQLLEYQESDKQKIFDAPEAIVQIRNAIVHSQAEKRKNLSAIHDSVKYEALQLCNWYIELSLLYILGYNANYHDRCSKERYTIDTISAVPWAKLDTRGE